MDVAVKVVGTDSDMLRQKLEGVQDPFVIKTIEWHMMDKHKYIPLNMFSSFLIRCILYPLTVVKTRIQVQKRKAVYSGTYDAFSKSIKTEGYKSLYRGFWISSVQIVSGVFYVTTYENTRHFLHSLNVTNSNVKALAGGAAASLVSQTLLVPTDIISQHLMVLGQKHITECGKKHYIVNPLEIDMTTKSRWRKTVDITRAIYRNDGIRGFYRGYFVSISTYVPNSAMWWMFYHFYQGKYTFWL